MAPVPTTRGGSPAPAPGVRPARPPAFPIPKRLIREIAHLVASRGRSLLRLEVSGHVKDNFDDIYSLSDSEEDIEMILPPAACGGSSGNLPPPENDLTSLAWLQDRNLLSGIHLNMAQQYSDDDSDVEAPPVNHNLLARIGRNSPPENRMNSPDSCSSSPTPPPPPTINGHVKPPHPFAYLIFRAMDSNPERALRVKEIYAWIMRNFPYYKEAPQGWKNSVRHNLSLNKWFHKVSASHRVGRGCLWTFYPQCREVLMQQAHAKCDAAPYPRRRPARRVVRPVPVPAPCPAAVAEGSSGDSPQSPGPEEYLAAAGVLTMKYGASVLEKLTVRHAILKQLVHDMRADMPSASNREERNTAEALLTLAGCGQEAERPT